MKKMGRPTKYSKEMLELAERTAVLQPTEEELAFVLGINQDTLISWKKKYPEFSEAIKKGSAMGKMSLRRALFKSAIERGNVSAQIFLAKNLLGMKDNQDVAVSGKIDNEIVIKVVEVKE